MVRRKRETVRWSLRLAVCAGIFAWVFGVLGPLRAKLLPWWLYGADAQRLGIAVVESGRSQGSVLSHGRHLEYRYYPGFDMLFGIAWLMSIGVAVVGCGLLERWLLGESGAGDGQQPPRSGGN